MNGSDIRTDITETSWIAYPIGTLRPIWSIMYHNKKTNKTICIPPNVNELMEGSHAIVSDNNSLEEGNGRSCGWNDSYIICSINLLLGAITNKHNYRT